MFTVLDARNLVAPYVESGVCYNDARVLPKINEATRRLMNKAKWWNLYRRIRFYTDKNSITLPREVEAVVRVDIDGQSVKAFHMAYDFIDGGPGDTQPGEGYCRDLVDLGDDWPVFFDIPYNTPSRLVAFSTELADEALNLTVWGRDSHNADVEPGGSLLPIMRWRGGVEGSVDATNIAPKLSVASYKEITGIAKPVTKGHICLYTYDPTDHRMYFLAKYHPDEIRPQYRRYRITAPDFQEGCNVLCLVKLRYVPHIRDTETLLIQNLDALKLMVMAIRSENDRKLSEAEGYEQKAVRALTEEHKIKQNMEIAFQISDASGLGSVRNLV